MKNHHANEKDDTFDNVEDVKWPDLSFKDLKDAYEIGDDSDREHYPQALHLKNRYGNIMNVLHSDRFWPPEAAIKSKLEPAMCEVLSRLSEEVFSEVEDNLSFILEDPTLEMLAINVEAPVIQDAKAKLRRGVDTIVFFHPAWRLSKDALIGLIAHEIAHSFTKGQNYNSDEQAVNGLVCTWGFEKELLCLEKEKQEINSIRVV